MGEHIPNVSTSPHFNKFPISIRKMENPKAEIEDVVRSITEPQDVETILKNVDKYFTEDAFVLHPLGNQPQCARGKENLKAIYHIFRQVTRDNKITFHATMFNDDLTQCALE